MSIAVPIDAATAQPMAGDVRHRRVPAWSIAIVLLIVLIVLNPAGYVGGGGDDWYYLEAARCAAAHGLCLPDTHWAERFPLVATMGAAIALFGASIWSVSLIPACYAAAATVLFALNVERRFGRSAAIVASIALLATPAISLHALQPLVDLPELAWVLASLLALQVAVDRDDGRTAAIAGAALALAVMTRMSAMAFVPIIGLGWLFLPADRRRLIVPFGAAMTAVLGGEAIAYWWTTGDPRYGWLLSLHHARIPTTELPAGIDMSKSTLFNLDVIRGWRRSMDIHVHWSVDPLLNLLADPRCGLTLIGAGVLAVVRWRDRAAWRWLGPLAIAAAAHFLIITYVLAIDPKPRIFLFEDAVAATAIGVIGVGAWRGGSRLVVAALLTLLIVRAAVITIDKPDSRQAAVAASDWIAAAPPGLTIDDWSRRTLALVPAAYALPVAAPTETAPMLTLTQESCRTAALSRGTGWSIARQASLAVIDPPGIGWLRTHAILLGERETPSLCLLTPPTDR